MEVNAVVQSDPEHFIGEMQDVFDFLSGLPGYRDSYKCSIATLDRIVRAIGYSYKNLYRMCRERDQERRTAFARLLLTIPLRCLVSVDETHKDGGDLRRRRGCWLRGLRNDCLSRDRKGLLQTSTMMAVGYNDGVIPSVRTPTPPAQSADDWLMFRSGLLPAMNTFVPGFPWSQQRERCVLLYDNAPIHTAEADNSMVSLRMTMRMVWELGPMAICRTSATLPRCLQSSWVKMTVWSRSGVGMRVRRRGVGMRVRRRWVRTQPLDVCSAIRV